MNRNVYFNYIEEKLGVLSHRINQKGKLNILDLHNHSENFYIYLLNDVYNWKLSNINAIKQNIEAIDLIDHDNTCICQVSATCTKEKVEASLFKEIIKQYSHYTFKFVSISKDGSALRRLSFKNPHGITFNPHSDIIDTNSLLKTILSHDIDKQRDIYELIKKELGSQVDILKLDSNLATIINILSKDSFDDMPKAEINSFEIERKINFNRLVKTRKIIEEYTAYHSRVDKKYVEFDALGVNKSMSVLASISKSYLKTSIKHSDEGPDSVFMKTIESVIEKVISSANFSQIPMDELELSVNILVVDAFIRCKIFENPSNYQYAFTR